jgi:poly(A) polymerase
MPVAVDRDLAHALSKIDAMLALRGQRGYIVGGFVRDWLLHRETADIDIAVSCAAASMARDIAEEVGGTFVLLDDVNDIARVVLSESAGKEEKTRGMEWHFDISSFGGDIESDLARRDFTINAMALELSQFALVCGSGGRTIPEPAEALSAKRLPLKLIDPFSGHKDLMERRLRRVSAGIFEVDAARLLRAVRLAAELDLVMDRDTEHSIRRHSQAIGEVPGERVREELFRLLKLPGAAGHLRYLDSLGLLPALIPELAEGKGVEQPTAHFWDVFDHSLQTVATIEFLIRESDWEYGNEDMLATAPWSDTIDGHLSREVSSGSNHRVLLKLGALLHDVAKPMTKSVDETGRARFLGHTQQGAALTAAILERMRFSSRETKLVEALVYHHLRPVQMSNGEVPTQRAIYRYFRDTGEAGIDILLLALADYLASRGPLVSIDEWRRHCQLMDYILAEHARQQAKTLPVKLLDGHDIMQTFDLAPGPLIGELLALVNEAYASGELGTREEALGLVRGELTAGGKRQGKPRRKAGGSGAKSSLTDARVE